MSPGFRLNLITLTLALPGLIFPVIAQNAPPEEAVSTATLAMMKAAPKVDGKVDPDEWLGAVGTFGFQNIAPWQGHVMDPRTGYTKVGFTESHLYILVVSAIPPTGIRARDLPRDAALITDDGLEIWIDPARDDREKGDTSGPFFQMLGNALGSIEDKIFSPDGGAAPDASWNGDWEFANGIDEESGIWTAELSIPFSDLKFEGTPVGRSIGVLVSRNYKMPWNQATWFPHRSGFESWAQYPRLLLTKDDPTVQVEALGDNILNGEIQFSANIFNPGEARSARIKFHVESSTMPDIESETVVALPAGATEPFTISTPLERLHADASHHLRFTVESEDGATTYMHWRLRWTNLEAAMKRVGGTGRLWDVKTGPDPDAAVKIGHYPSYSLLKLTLDLDALDDAAAEIRQGVVTILNSDGKAIFEEKLEWEESKHEWVLPIPDLDEGEYTVKVGLADYPTTFERSLIRRVYPWEGNQLGITDDVLPPFEPMVVEGNAVNAVLRRYVQDGLGLWSSIMAEGNVSAGGPMELLKAPMQLVYGGKPLDGSGSFTESKPNRVVYKGQANADGVGIETEAVTEEDGVMRFTLTFSPETDDAKLPVTHLDIPLVDELMPLWHCSTTGLRVNPAGKTPEGDGVVWDSRDFPDGDWFGNFKPYIWLGAEELGLAWFADNDKGWVLDVDPQNPDQSAPSLELIRQNGTLMLRVNFVQRPFRLREPRTITFGLMATPGKPMRPDWRAVQFETKHADFPVIRWMGSQYWGSDTRFAAKYPRNKDLSILDRVSDTRQGIPYNRNEFLTDYQARNFGDDQPLADKTEEQIMTLVRATLGWADQSQGKQFLNNAYWEEFHSTLKLHEEWETFGSEWSGRHGYGPVGGVVRSHQDFAIWWGREFIRRGIGLYFDNAFPMRAYDPITTEAYVLPDGRIQPSAGIWARREYLRRIWVLHQLEAKPEMPVLQMIHMTNTNLAPYLVWNESILDWEWYYGPEPQQSKYSAAVLRAQSLGRQTGNIPLALAVIDGTTSPEEEAFVERSRFGTMFVHEIKVRMFGADGELLRQALEFGYGHPDCLVFNYWDKSYPVSVDSSGSVKSILLERDQRLLLVLVSWESDAITTELTLDTSRLTARPGAAIDRETGDAIGFDADSGRLKVNLDGYAVRLIELH